MTSGATGATGSTGSENEHLPVVFLGIVLVEFIVIAALYWFGSHFV